MIVVVVHHILFTTSTKPLSSSPWVTSQERRQVSGQSLSWRLCYLGIESDDCLAAHRDTCRVFEVYHILHETSRLYFRTTTTNPRRLPNLFK